MAAPAPAKMTITAKVGPGNTVTTQILTNVTAYDFNCNTNVLRVVCDQGTFFFDVNAATTWTTTISSGVQTITIS